MQYIIFCVILILLDQYTKYLTVKHIMPFGSVGVFDGILSLTYVKNTGAAWGILPDARWFFIIFTLFVLLYLMWYIIKNPAKNKLFKTAISLVYAGAIGNLIDRVLRGFVVDMIKLDFINFPVFNVADCCVVVGAILFCVYILFLYDKEKINE